MTVEVQPYFAVGERYPALIGVRAEGDEYETAYVSKSELVDALAENAKLRELVHGLNHCTTWANEDGKDCWSCPLWHEKNCTAGDIERELGIEVKS